MNPWRELTPATAPVVRVEWYDIVSADSWNDDEENATPATLVDVGWLLEDNPKWIRIATTYDYDSCRWARFRLLPKMPPEVDLIQDAVGAEQEG